MRAPFPAAFLIVAMCCGCAATDGDAAQSPAGQAVHLDDRQRIVIIHADAVGTACTEPSPDALAAFASSLGEPISVDAQAAKSEANALGESAASIGLRTQLITLIRDALYRACEAYETGQLSKSQMMALMARLQDLSAAIATSEEPANAAAALQAEWEQQLEHEMRKADAGGHARNVPPSPGQRAH
jgi:hypothetical protein